MHITADAAYILQSAPLYSFIRGCLEYLPTNLSCCNIRERERYFYYPRYNIQRRPEEYKDDQLFWWERKFRPRFYIYREALRDRSSSRTRTHANRSKSLHTDVLENYTRVRHDTRGCRPVYEYSVEQPHDDFFLYPITPVTFVHCSCIYHTHTRIYKERERHIRTHRHALVHAQSALVTRVSSWSCLLLAHHQCCRRVEGKIAHYIYRRQLATRRYSDEILSSPLLLL